MDASNVFTGIKIVPVVVISHKNVAVGLARALKDAGIDAVEVTLRSEDALDAIELIANQVPEITVGAGSLRRPGQFAEVIGRGASFGVSPGATSQLIEAAQEHGFPFVPGASTASEMIALTEHGYTLQKFFPAELNGGVQKLKALSAPLPEVKFFPTGGINAAVVSDYLELDCVSCVGGSWFVPEAQLNAGDYAAIRELAEEAVRETHLG